MKALLAPRITVEGVPGFLLWARRDNPALYAGLVREFPEVAAFDQELQGVAGFGSLTSALRNFGTTLASSAKKIGSFVATNALPIAAAAVPLLVAKKQADIAMAQVKLADAQMAPMQTAIGADGVAMPVQQVAGQWQAVPVTGGVIAAPVSVGAAPPGVPWWAWAVGAGGVLLLVLRR